MKTRNIVIVSVVSGVIGAAAIVIPILVWLVNLSREFNDVLSRG